MFKSAASVSSLAYNFLLSFLLLFAYNGIFLQKLYAVTGSGWDFVSVNLIVFLLLFAACNLLLWPKTAKPLAAFFLMANAVCLYFMADYHIAIDKIMLLNALETDSAEAADLFIIKKHQAIDHTLAVFDKTRISIRIDPAGQKPADHLRTAFGIDRSPAAKAAVCFLLF